MPVISTGYTPRTHQAKLHQILKRFNVLVCHRRFGKSVFSINEMIDQGVRNQRRNPQYAYVGPSYGQVKRIAWEYIKDYTRSIPGSKPNEAELRVDVPRGTDKIRFMLLSAENPDSLRGIYLDGVIFDEYAEMDPVVWSQVVRPALSDRLGWAIFIGTPKGKNHFYDIFTQAQNLPDWYSTVLKASETRIVPDEELRAAREIMSPEEYAQEFECDFGAALVGAYFGQQLKLAEAEGRITSVPKQDHLDVHTFWDVGIDDHTAIWFMQEAGREFHFIKYYEQNDKGLDHYVQFIKRLEHEKGYVFGEHYFPHDMMAKELGTGRTRIETIKSLGLTNARVIPRQKVEDQISAARLALGRCWFDRVECARGLEALSNYQRKWDNEDKVYMNKPLHNWASHGADAFKQFAIGYKDAGVRKNFNKLPRQVETNYDIFEV